MPLAPFTPPWSIMLGEHASYAGWHQEGVEYDISDNRDDEPSAIKFNRMRWIQPKTLTPSDGVCPSAFKAGGMAHVALPAAAGMRFQSDDLVELRQCQPPSEDDEDGDAVEDHLYLRVKKHDDASRMAELVPVRLWRGGSQHKNDGLYVQLVTQSGETRVEHVTPSKPLCLSDDELHVSKVVNISALWRDERELEVVHLKLKAKRNPLPGLLMALAAPPPLSVQPTAPSKAPNEVEQRLSLLEAEVSYLRAEIDSGRKRRARDDDDVGSSRNAERLGGPFCLPLPASTAPSSLPDEELTIAVEHWGDGLLKQTAHPTAEASRTATTTTFCDIDSQLLDEMDRLHLAPAASLQEWCMHRSRGYALPVYDEPTPVDGGRAMTCRVTIRDACDRLVLSLVGEAAVSKRGATMAAAEQAMHAVQQMEST
ncbi:hypothetical protein KFE25_012551 [Diacronema lutheri]|uniref:Uncharacterized protein n=1 Tax=Diacronema lutheri TaxID=2081491 RepID=A0A8J6CF23_DIALT|nr:hypothetical protein KFE25_012551 [Diacronema lutheri]